MRWERGRGKDLLTRRSALIHVSHLMGPVDLARNCASLPLETELFLNPSQTIAVAYSAVPPARPIRGSGHYAISPVRCRSQRQPRVKGPWT